MSRRSYTQYCGLAKALDVVGERWTLLIVRNLLLGPLRYTELLRGLPGITTNLLAKRLQEMEEAGLLERIRPTSADAGHAYQLTRSGRALEPAVHALARWGWSRMREPGKDDLRSFEWFAVSLRRRYRGGTSLTAELVADGVPYHVVLTPEHADVGRGSPPRPELRVKAPGMALAGLFLGGWPGQVPEGMEVEGTADQLHALVEAFDRGDPPPG